MSRWTQSISRASHNGMALSKAVYGAMQRGKGAPSTASETIKSVLLDEARREPLPNTLAISILKIDKEVGLVRYWGLAEYLKQNQAFSFASLSSKLFSGKVSPVTDIDDDGNKHNNNNKNDDDDDSSADGGSGASPRLKHGAARVAFMITSSMKRDLIDGLGYQASVVKGMTPKQASIVLHHRVSPDSYSETIPGLEKALEEELQLQQQTTQQRLEATEDLMEEPERAARTVSTAGTTEASEVSSAIVNNESDSHSSDRTDEVPLMLSSSSSHASQESSSSPPPLSSTPLSPVSSAENDSFAGGTTSSLDETNTNADGDDDGDLWYEVVEVWDEGTETTNEIRHGLYKDHEEALLGLEARQMIQRKREKERQSNVQSDVTERIMFVIRPISGIDL